MGPFYRRSPRLVAYWRGERFVVHAYRGGPAFSADPALVRMLDAFSSWTAIEWYREAIGTTLRAARRTLDALVARGLLERSSEPPRQRPETAWDTWGEAAAFLHFSTRDREFLQQRRAAKVLADRVKVSGPPSPVKSYQGLPRIVLPKVRERSRLETVLKERRTWRRFGKGPVAIADLAAVLHLTFGVQRWVDLGRLGRVMLRSSPSGGARHPIEAYLIVRHVETLSGGAYYYAPDEHALVRLTRRRVSPASMSRMVGGQPWYGGAGLLVVLTAVLARKAWAYRSARAYRSLLLEAGHFCQTWCLTATARGLAPFCTGAFSESIIEQSLALEADQETVLYVAGLGTRPPGVRWAPLPEGEEGLGE